MGQILLRNAAGTRTFAGDLHVTRVVWTSFQTRAAGELSLRIPVGHPALSVIDPYGGTWVRFQHEALGPWSGRVVGEPPRISREFIEVTARDLTGMLQQQPVEGGDLFTFMPAGVIAEAAVRRVILSLGDGVLRPGSFAIAPPLVPEVRFEGQELLSLLGDLAEATGQELEITEDGVINWGVARRQLYRHLLAEDGDLVYLGETADTASRVARVTAYDKDGRNGTTVVATELVLEEPRRVIIRTDATSDVALDAEARAYLAAHRQPVITYELGLLPDIGDPEKAYGEGAYGEGFYGGVKGAHWRAVREGDSIQYCLPRGRPLGETRGAFGVGCVLRREYGDDMAFPTLTVHELRPWDALTIAAALERERLQYTIPDSVERRLAVRSSYGGDRLVTDTEIKAVSVGKLTGQVGTQQIAASAITAGRIAESSVTSGKLALSTAPSAGALAGYLILQSLDGTIFHVPRHLPS